MRRVSLIGVAFVISQIVLNRLESDQENNLRHVDERLSRRTVGGGASDRPFTPTSGKLSTRSIARATVTPGLKVRFAIVALPNGKVLAASDPLKFPVQSPVPADVEQRFPARGRTHHRHMHPAARGSLALFARKAIRSDAFWRRSTFPSCFACAKQVLLTLVAVNAGLALGFATIGIFRSQADAEALERTQWVRGARSSRTR